MSADAVVQVNEVIQPCVARWPRRPAIAFISAKSWASTGVASVGIIIWGIRAGDVPGLILKNYISTNPGAAAEHFCGKT
jgi:hypothetical protein